MTPIAARWVARLYRAYYATLRVRSLLPDGRVIRAVDYPMDGQIFALCERDAIALAGLIANRRFIVLVAQGRDGNWASALLAEIGCRVVRGSSRRGGTRALQTLVRTLKNSDDPVAFVVDGPLGPAGVAKPGAVLCALKSDRPVRALGLACRWKLTLPRTWSGIYLPMPCSTVLVALPEAQEVDADGADIAARTRHLTDQLVAARQRADGFLS